MPKPRTGGASYRAQKRREAITGRAYDQLNGVSRVRIVTSFGARADGPRERCPACDTDVPTRSDGSLRNHRVGRSKDSWPCPGRDAAPRS